MRRVSIYTIILVAFTFLPAQATICNVPDDHPTIQECINSSSHGDTVLVQAGTYYENINFNGLNIVLGSLFLTTGDESYISQTIIDGSQGGSVITLNSGEDNTAQVVGFTIQNGYADEGGGIYCMNSSPTISDNIISNNSTSSTGNSRGGGIYCEESNPIIENNKISNNLADGGGGICCNMNCIPTIRNNSISACTTDIVGGGISMIHNCTGTIEYNIISSNYSDEGGGIYCHNSDPDINHNTTYNNEADINGGGILSDLNSNPTILNTILCGNLPTDIDLKYGGTVTITYSDVCDSLWPGEGNIDCDPMFCDLDTGNYYLAYSSCCLGAGEAGEDIGAYGLGCYYYLPGDVNMALGIWPPTVIGGDVTYLVGYFIGGGQASCLLDGFWCSADINGDCIIIGGDVTALVQYFVAGGPLVPCPDYEPAWPPVPDDQPLGWPNCETPVINSRVIPTGSVK